MKQTIKLALAWYGVIFAGCLIQARIISQDCGLNLARAMR